MANDDFPHQENATRKRKSDVLSRVAEGTTSSKGRGSESGWTCCPLCEGYSKKRFALGRGITAHLHAMHTPWNPGSVERKKQKRMLKRQESERKRNKTVSTAQVTDGETPLTCWEPTRQEQEAWDERVIQIASEIEKKAKSNNTGNEEWAKPGLDRNGKQTKSYRESLPPFIQAAANGDQGRLAAMVQECRNTTASDNEQDSVQKLLNTRDRNGSTAEHWAAGGGHLSCLQFLLQLGGSFSISDDNNSTDTTRVRRRDGKTCLHYAARNGHLECIRYLIKQGFRADDASGDGTTALHMACYGGHVEVVECLITNGANVHNVNEWECGCAHWVGMTQSESVDDVRDLCRLLQAKGVSFVTSQKQGHTPLHKAAQRKNRHVIEWMMESSDEGGAGLSPNEVARAAQPDVGGHRASEIWRSVRGDESFAKKIERIFESS